MFFIHFFFFLQHNKNETKPSSSLPSSPPPPTSLWFRCGSMGTDGHTHILWRSLAFPWLHSLSPNPSWCAAHPRAVQLGGGWILGRNRASPYVLFFADTFHGHLTKPVRLIHNREFGIRERFLWEAHYHLPSRSMPQPFQLSCSLQLHIRWHQWLCIFYALIQSLSWAREAFQGLQTRCHRNPLGTKSL